MKDSPLREIEEALWAAARIELGDRVLSRKSLASAIARVSERYTRERQRLGEALDTDAELAARAVFFTVDDAAKIAVPLAELETAGALPGRAPLRVLDAGAGCGAMTLGLYARLGPDRRLEVTAVDRDVRALSIFDTAVEQLGADIDLETRVSGLETRRSSARFDIIACGSVLNELDETAAADLAAQLIDQLDPEGALIVIEPALRETSRRLHRLRDAIVGRGLGHVFAPCTRTAARCPALDDERDWCHEDRPADPPPRLGQLSRATGLRQHRLKFSYLVVRRQPGTVAGDRPALRVVSRLKKTKGASYLYVCDDAGRRELRLQKRDRDDANRPFERARRGELMVIDGDDDDIRAVERIDPARD